MIEPEKDSSNFLKIVVEVVMMNTRTNNYITIFLWLRWLCSTRLFSPSLLYLHDSPPHHSHFINSSTPDNSKMSANDELIDYEDDQDIVANGATGASAGSAVARAGDGVEGEKNFSGIHSTGFR
jgi:hypothetical protein